MLSHAPTTSNIRTVVGQSEALWRLPKDRYCFLHVSVAGEVAALKPKASGEACPFQCPHTSRRRNRRAHRITLANWRHAFYERHPFVTLGGLLTGLLLTGLLLKAPLVSSSSSPELRKPPHKLRNTAAPI